MRALGCPTPVPYLPRREVYRARAGLFRRDMGAADRRPSGLCEQFPGILATGPGTQARPLWASEKLPPVLACRRAFRAGQEKAARCDTGGELIDEDEMAASAARMTAADAPALKERPSARYQIGTAGHNQLAGTADVAAVERGHIFMPLAILCGHASLIGAHCTHRQQRKVIGTLACEDHKRRRAINSRRADETC